jgi:predicted PurR-regulated permease PerM
MGGSGPTSRTILRAVVIVVAAVAVLYIAYLLRTPLSWIVVAAFLAIAVAAPVEFLSRRMPRGLAIAIVYLGVVLLPVALAALLVPPVVTQASDLIARAPDYARDISAFVQSNDTLQQLEQQYDITGTIEAEAAKLPSKIGDAAGALRDFGAGIVGSIFAAVTILILSVFMVGGGPRWIRGLLERQPPERAARLRGALDSIGGAVGNYVGGAMLQATIAGVTTFVVLLILGVPAAGTLAVVVALLDLIPLVGATLGAVLVGIVTLFTNFPTATIVWAIWAIVYQQIENNVIQPQIQRRAVRLEPFVVLVAVLFGSTLFGVIGAILAIPVAATLQIAAKELLAYRAETRAASSPTGVTPSAPPGPAAEPP